MYLIKDLYPEYIQNSYNFIKQTNKKVGKNMKRHFMKDIQRANEPNEKIFNITSH